MRSNAGWAIRRRIIYMTLIFCAGVVGKVVIFGPDSETLVTSSFSLAGAVIASYIFGATWDDQNERSSGRSTVEFESSSPTATTTTVTPPSIVTTAAVPPTEEG